MKSDELQEKCAIFGVYGHPEAANLTYLGLYALQHRGQESTGIVASTGKEIHAEISMGLVAEVFTEERLDKLPGHIAIGHNRYSTTGASLLKNAQPILVDYALGSLALAHNGNLVNAYRLKAELEAFGSIFRSTMDSEVIVHLIAGSKESQILGRVVEALHRLEGAYSLTIMTDRELIGARDPCGFRPLSLGRLGDAYILASESCAFDLIEATFVRDIEPGEIVVIDDSGLTSYYPLPRRKPAQCIFEFIYFSRPDSNVFGRNIHLVRKTLGAQLAKEMPVEADIVVPVPDSGIPAALGYAEASGIPFEVGLIRNHYIGRTFIEPQQAIRYFGVRIKLNPNKKSLQGKRVVIVDDSIVRGTTSRKIIQMIRAAGAKEVHIRISSPPYAHPCYYGIDTPNKKELIAATHSREEIRRYLTADTVAYLGIENLAKAISPGEEDFCYACFSGQYPVESIERELAQLRLF
jgi:amidophosphoribosyltransferase